MKSFPRSLHRCVIALGLTLIAALPMTAHACATCFGKSDSKLAEGLNMGIFALLGMVVLVLGWLTGFFIYLGRRAAALEAENAASEAPIPPTATKP